MADVSSLVCEMVRNTGLGKTNWPARLEGEHIQTEAEARLWITQ